MARLLIAGYGFLGAALDMEFRQAGWKIDRLSRTGANGGISCDISSPTEVAVLEGEYDLIIHCAASGGGGAEAYRQVYLEGCRNLLNRFPEPRFIFTSSTSVYSQMDHSEVTEKSPAEPITATARILRDAEKLVLTSGGIVARLSGLYGPGRCHVLKNLLNGSARIEGEGIRIMNFIHRADAARALLRLSALKKNNSAGEIYNITALPVSQRDCYAALADYYQLPLPAQAEGAPINKRGAGSKRVSNSKMVNLGWQPEYADFLSMALACREE